MKNLHLDLSPFNVNGVIHVGANEGDYAKYYHDLGVYKVLWLEQQGHKYGALYSNTCQYGMKQDILITQLLDHDEPPVTKKLVTVWRENASFLDIDSYDLLHIATRSCRKMILDGCDWLLDGFKEIVFTGPDDDDLEDLQEYLGARGFVLDSHVQSDDCAELLFLRK